MALKKNLKLAAILTTLLTVLAGCGDDTARYAGFAQCLTDSGMVMYGSFRCPHCLKMKELFGSSFSNIKYVECDQLSRVYDKATCEAKNITGFPTWIFGDGSQDKGEKTFEFFAEKTGCKLPDGATPSVPTTIIPTETQSDTTAAATTTAATTTVISAQEETIATSTDTTSSASSTTK